jgi:hypothetical protein
MRGELLIDMPSIVVSDLYLRGEPILRMKTVATRRGQEEYTIRLRAFETYVGCHWRLEARGSFVTGGEYNVPVSWTEPNYGGRRARFHCPACDRTARVLYLSGTDLRCRVCSRIQYLSQRLHMPHYVRPLARANEICVRLGGNPGELVLPPRPRGMHHRTYDRLQREFEAGCRGDLAGSKIPPEPRVSVGNVLAKILADSLEEDEAPSEQP